MPIQLSEVFTTRKLLSFALPTILMMVFISIYSVVDGIFVGIFVGSNGLAAINIVFPLVMAIASFGLMLGAGGSAEVAKKLGQGQKQRALEYFTLLTITTLVIGLVLSGISLIFLRPICYAMGASELIIEDCLVYGRICLIGNVFFMLQMFFQSFLVTAERPKMGFHLSLVSGLLNILLDVLLIAILGFGLAGAALATICGFTIGSVIPIIYFMKKNTSQLRFVKPVFEKGVILRSMGNGSSEMVTNVSRSLVALLFNIQLMKLLGEAGVAAISVMLYVEFVFTAVLIGFAVGIAPIIAFKFGAKQGAELKAVFLSSIHFVIAVSLLMFVLSQVLAQGLVMLFIRDNPDLISLTVKGFRIFAISFLACGINIFASAYFTALGNGKVSALISFLRTLVLQAIMIMVLPLFFGLNGIWMALPVAELMTVAISLLYFKKNQGIFEILKAE